MLHCTLPQMLTRLLVDHSEDERMFLLVTLTTVTKTTVITMTTNATVEMVKTPIIAMATNATIDQDSSHHHDNQHHHGNNQENNHHQDCQCHRGNDHWLTQSFFMGFLVYILSFEIFMTYNSFLFGYF